MTYNGNPTYNVKYYRDGFYKLIRFNRSLISHLPDDSKVLDDPDRGEAEGKFSQALSRARSVVFQLALCNDWQYFFTGTISPENYCRDDLQSFYTDFSQWIRDQRKKGNRIEYFFIPERHKDGSWHLHGCIRGLPDSEVCSFIPGVHPQRLIDNGFLNWPAYGKKFGFCSLAPLRDVVGVAWYVTKYITKDMERSVSDFGAHTYYCSIGLRRAVPLGSIYGRYPALDVRCDRDGQFCSTGFVTDVSWDFWLPYFPVVEQLDPVEYPEDEPEIFTNVDINDLQLSLYDLCPEYPG